MEERNEYNTQREREILSKRGKEREIHSKRGKERERADVEIIVFR